MIQRTEDLNAVSGLLRRYPVVGILGARQAGKSTLAARIAKRSRGPFVFLDLEDPAVLARLSDPMLALRDLRGLVVLDEIQLAPNLFPVLRVLADRPRRPARFLVLGSASPDLLRQGAETLAGRIRYHSLDGFSLADVGAANAKRLWLRGGFPLSYTASSDAASHDWRAGFVATFLQRDLPQLGIRLPAETMRRLWTMIAHGHGQIWNSHAMAGNFGVADSTVRTWLDQLVGALVVRVLLPWHENLGKRQVKSPKVYVSDTGLLHALLNHRTHDDLMSSPKSGASWEGFAISQVARRLRAAPEECFFWATHHDAELDLLVVRGRRRLGFEMKLSEAPSVTPSMRIAMADLKLDRLDVIHAGETTYPLAPGIRAVAMKRLWSDLDVLQGGI